MNVSLLTTSSSVGSASMSDGSDDVTFNTSSTLGSASMSDWSDSDTFSRCSNNSDLTDGVALSFELSTLFLVTSIDTHGTSDVSAVRVEYGLSDVSMITYYDERLETNVRQKED